MPVPILKPEQYAHIERYYPHLFKNVPVYRNSRLEQPSPAVEIHDLHHTGYRLPVRGWS